MKRSTVNILGSYIDALHPIIYINHFDFKVIDDAIERVGKNVKCVEFNNALGLVDFKTKSPMKECDLEQFLRLTMDDGFEQETILILKDIHGEINNPKIIIITEITILVIYSTLPCPKGCSLSAGFLDKKEPTIANTSVIKSLKE